MRAPALTAMLMTILALASLCDAAPTTRGKPPAQHSQPAGNSSISVVLPSGDHSDQLSSTASEDIDLCTALQNAVSAVEFNGKKICALSKCDATGTQIACDKIDVEITIPGLNKKITDKLSIDAGFNVCVKDGEPATIKMSFKDTGLVYDGGEPAKAIEWSQTFSAAASQPVKVPIVSLLVVSVYVDLTVGIQKEGSGLKADISADICAQAAVGSPYCGNSLLPGSLPLVILNQSLPIGDFCTNPPPPGTLPNGKTNDKCFAGLPLMCVEVDEKAGTIHHCTATCKDTYIALGSAVGLVVVLSGCCICNVTGRKKNVLSVNDA